MLNKLSLFSRLGLIALTISLALPGKTQQGAGWTLGTPQDIYTLTGTDTNSGIHITGMNFKLWIQGNENCNTLQYIFTSLDSGSTHYRTEVRITFDSANWTSVTSGVIGVQVINSIVNHNTNNWNMQPNDALNTPFPNTGNINSLLVMTGSKPAVTVLSVDPNKIKPTHYTIGSGTYQLTVDSSDPTGKTALWTGDYTNWKPVDPDITISNSQGYQPLLWLYWNVKSTTGGQFYTNGYSLPPEYPATGC